LTSKIEGQEKMFLVSTMPKTPSTELGTSKHGCGFFFCAFPPSFNAKSKRLNTIKIAQLCAWRFGHGFEQFFCFQSPILGTESRRLKTIFFLPWPHFEFLSLVLRVLSMANINFFGLGLLFSAPKVGG
jgi:hypothetical protein